MRNEYEQQVAWDSYRSMMQDLAWQVSTDQSALDLPPAPRIRIRDPDSVMIVARGGPRRSPPEPGL